VQLTFLAEQINVPGARGLQLVISNLCTIVRAVRH